MRAKKMDAELDQLILNGVPGGVVITNEEHLVLSWTPGAQRIFGYAEGELHGRQIDSRLPQRLRHSHVAHRSRYFDQPRTRTMGAGLELLGFLPHLRMISATDARQGIALALERHTDVILMDIDLPGMNGNQAQRILRNDMRTAHIPVIALTAKAMTGDIRHGLASGFFRYLTKPVEIPRLNTAIEEALQLVRARLPLKPEE